MDFSVVFLCFSFVNVVTFIVYGIDKRKAKMKRWRIPESVLILLAVIGGSIGAWVGMKVWHHKTQHAKFKYGVPVVVLLQILFVLWFLKDMPIF